MEEFRAREISEHIDRLITVDFHTRKFIIELYEAARKCAGNVPLTYKAASAIMGNVKPGSTVIFLSGFPTSGEFVAEQDGPVGAAMLARVLSELLQVRSVVLTDESQAQMTRECFMGCGFSLVDKAAREDHQVLVRGVKENQNVGAENILNEFAPSAVIAIERPSKNIDGKYMSMKGLDISYKVARLDEVIENAKQRGILTIGVGDGGNESGCGLIREDVLKYHPNGPTIASCIKTDILVFASISNFGAYGIAGALAALKGDIYALPDKQTLILTLMNAARSGLHNGPPKWLDPGTDGIPFELEAFVWESIRRMIWEEVNPHFPKFY